MSSQETYLDGHRSVRGWRPNKWHVSACECGWSSPLYSSLQRAEEAFRGHLADRADTAATVIVQDACEEADEVPEYDEHEQARLVAPRYNEFPPGF